MRTVAVTCLLLCLTIVLFAGVGDGQWLSRVPRKDAARENPFAKSPTAVPAGERLFRQHCAECHGEDAQGRNGKPDLVHSPDVAAATQGELFWLLTNGSLKNGMPSWSRLPEQQRWAIVSYLKTLDSR